MAELNVIPPSPQADHKSLCYLQWDWCDYVRGSKAQLQALGIGVGVPYPGDPEGPKWKMRTEDPRGFSVQLRNDGDGTFTAFVTFPGWPTNPIWEKRAFEFCRGVQKHESRWYDEYVGSADDLIAAGLLMPDQLPGLPGMRKVCVSICADGSVVNGAPTSPSQDWNVEGSKRVSRAGKRFRVEVKVSADESDRRCAILKAKEVEWQAIVRGLPRPARLDRFPPRRGDATPRQRGHLRLVWAAA